MDGSTMTFIKDQTTRTGQYHSSRFKMETVLVVSRQSHGISGVTGKSAMTTRFSLISPVPESSPPKTLAKILSALFGEVLRLVVVDCGN
jgi:hypothetical protein